jgi:hypothetical protein
MTLKSFAAAVALTLASAGGAAAQGTHLSVEGGVACSNNRALIDVTGFGTIGNKGCGGTGAVEFGQTGKPVFSIFDHWAIRGRYTTFDHSRDLVVPGGAAVLSFEDSRVVVDAELGAKLGFGLFGGTSRATIGVRAAKWNGDLEARGTAGAVLGESGTARFETSMVGVRLGLRSSIPLGTHWMYESNMGAAAMHGSHRSRSVENGMPDGDTKASNPVFSIDTSSALSYKFNGTDTGLIGSVGLFSEYWFKQIDIDGDRRNRNSWGPFIRARMPLQ